jgi:sulfotransferase
MVRDPVEILCSMERKFRQASLQDQGLVNHGELQNTTLEKRLDHWVAAPPVGLAMERLLEIVRQGIDAQMLFIDYDRLCDNPRQQLERLYSYLEIPS